MEEKIESLKTYIDTNINHLCKELHELIKYENKTGDSCAYTKNEINQELSVWYKVKNAIDILMR